MRYLGGKNRIRKHVADVLESLRRPGQLYFEPFVGGAWVLQEISGKRVASDGNFALITMYRALQDGWVPPENISEETYIKVRAEMDLTKPITAFVGLGCCFAGKWFGGYARSGERNYANNARNSLLRQLPLIKTTRFIYGTFAEHHPNGMLIYCDPPYQGTTTYGAFSGFDHELFWNTMREWAKNNTVVVSEYSSPEDFGCIKKIVTKTDLATNNGKAERAECLFMLKK